jgi:hypothetical protein
VGQKKDLTLFFARSNQTFEGDEFASFEIIISKKARAGLPPHPLRPNTYIRDWIYSAERCWMCVFGFFLPSSFLSLSLCYVGHYFIIVRDGAEKN